MANYFHAHLPAHGVPTHISEILNTPDSSLDGASVRVVGRVMTFDPSSSIAELADPKPSASAPAAGSLRVNTELVDCEGFVSGGLVMIIGELETEDEDFDFNKNKDSTDQSTSSPTDMNDSLADLFADISSDFETMELNLQSPVQSPAKKIQKLETGTNTLTSGQLTGAPKQSVRLILKARVATCCDRLDYELYRRGVDVKRTLSLD